MSVSGSVNDNILLFVHISYTFYILYPVLCPVASIEVAFSKYDYKDNIFL